MDTDPRVATLNDIREGLYDFHKGAERPTDYILDFFEEKILPIVPEDAEVGAMDGSVYASWPHPLEEKLSIEVTKLGDKIDVDLLSLSALKREQEYLF